MRRRPGDTDVSHYREYPAITDHEMAAHDQASIDRRERNRADCDAYLDALMAQHPYGAGELQIHAKFSTAIALANARRLEDAARARVLP